MTGRVIIDVLGFTRHSSHTRITALSLKQHKKSARIHVDGENSPASSTMSAESEFLEKGGRPTAEQQRKNKEELLAQKKYLLLMTPMLPGFSLQLKKWSKVLTRIIIKLAYYFKSVVQCQ